MARATKKIGADKSHIEYIRKFETDISLIQIKNAFDLALEYRKDTNFYAQSAIRMAIIFNGGAIIIIINLLVNLLVKKYYIDGVLFNSIWRSLMIFIFGAFLSIVASTSSYFGNLNGTRYKAIDANILFLTTLIGKYKDSDPELSREIGEKIEALNKERVLPLKSANRGRLLVIISMSISYIVFLSGVTYAAYNIYPSLNGEDENFIKSYIIKTLSKY